MIGQAARRLYRSLSCGVVLSVLMGPGSVPAQGQDTFALRPLRELGPMSIVIEQIAPEGRAAGVTEAYLRDLVIMRLRSHGVDVVTEEKPAPRIPYLYVQVNAIHLESIGHFVYSAQLDLHQIVRLARSAQTVRASTWDSGVVAVIADSRMQDHVTEAVNGLVTDFLTDYRAANGPGQGVAAR